LKGCFNLKMKALWSFKTSGSIYLITQQ
jgi:hypothetical protein